jgi:hypothetical protein
MQSKKTIPKFGMVFFGVDFSIGFVLSMGHAEVCL